MSELKVQIIPALRDNYSYAVFSPSTREAAIIDCPDAKPIIEFLESHGLKPKLAIATHHHADHISGFPHLLEKYPELKIAGYKFEERIPQLSLSLDEGEQLEICGTICEILFVPGHTKGHIALFFPQIGAVFTGDTMFSAGCGRIFEGTPEQLLSSLQKLAALPKQTKVYCGHEYTESNLRFALSLEPENTDIQNYYQQVKKLRGENKPSLPSTIELELKVNPFLRTDSDPIRKKASQLGAEPDDPVSIFAAIRKLKDRF